MTWFENVTEYQVCFILEPYFCPSDRLYPGKQIFDEEGGNEARTIWKRVKREDDRTTVCFTPVTGRTHQVQDHTSLDHFYGLAAGGQLSYGEGLFFLRLFTILLVGKESQECFS